MNVTIAVPALEKVPAHFPEPYRGLSDLERLQAVAKIAGLPVQEFIQLCIVTMVETYESDMVFSPAGDAIGDGFELRHLAFEETVL